jgi:hypothetical protein
MVQCTHLSFMGMVVRVTIFYVMTTVSVLQYMYRTPYPGTKFSSSTVEQ